MSTVINIDGSRPSNRSSTQLVPIAYWNDGEYAISMYTFVGMSRKSGQLTYLTWKYKCDSGGTSHRPIDDVTSGATTWGHPDPPSASCTALKSRIFLAAGAA